MRVRVVWDGEGLDAKLGFLWLKWDLRPWIGRLRWADARMGADQRAALQKLLFRARVSRCVVHVRYDLGDAAWTAVAHGALCTVLGALESRLWGCEMDADLQPAFEDRLMLQGHVEFSARAPAWAVAAAYRSFYMSQKERKICSIKAT